MRVLGKREGEDKGKGSLVGEREGGRERKGEVHGGIKGGVCVWEKTDWHRVMFHRPYAGHLWKPCQQ